jgi:peptidyl-tRNA hydrolase, PTH1 family
MLLKPETYMNESGRSGGAALRYAKLDLSALIVIHDELDLAPGKVRVKVGGSDAGHNGLRSITAHLGPDYKRVRIGIDHPGDKALVHHYVLSDCANRRRAGSRRSAGRSPRPPTVGRGPGRELPEQDASRHGGGGLRREV